MRKSIKKSRRWVVKIGSSLLTNNGQSIDYKAIERWVTQISFIMNQGIDIVLVSSGAVAAGMAALGWSDRPTEIPKLQAAAAVGQVGLIECYKQLMSTHDKHVAQILLDHDDMSNRTRYLNARSTIKNLLSLGVLPVVNENDTVTTEEIRFGDNDSLAGLVANLIDADYLIILTDQIGMFDRDPREDPNALLLDQLSCHDKALVSMAGAGGPLGQGGMLTKVRAAQIADRSGAHTLIVGGAINDVLLKCYRGESVGTMLVSDRQPRAARKRWLAGQLQLKGELIIDAGAAKALVNAKKSLLPAGILVVNLEFNRGDVVKIFDDQKVLLGQGLVNYRSEDLQKIKGLPSALIQSTLGFKNEDEIIHRDNLVISDEIQRVS